jgi:hypothetical protein
MKIIDLLNLINDICKLLKTDLVINYIVDFQAVIDWCVVRLIETDN